MAARADRSRRRSIAWALAAALAILAAGPAYLALPTSWRLAAGRLSCAAIAAVGSLRALRWARRAMGTTPVSPLDSEPPPLPPPELDWRFSRIHDDVVSGTRSHRYFEVIVWPRLVELGGTGLSQPPSRHGVLRRGPSLRALEHVVAEIERLP